MCLSSFCTRLTGIAVCQWLSALLLYSIKAFQQLLFKDHQVGSAPNQQHLCQTLLCTRGLAACTYRCCITTVNRGSQFLKQLWFILHSVGYHQMGCRLVWFWYSKFSTGISWKLASKDSSLVQPSWITKAIPVYAFENRKNPEDKCLC